MADLELNVVEEQMNELDEDDAKESSKKKGKKKKLKQRIKDFFQNPKKRLIFIIVVGLIIIAGFGVGLYMMSHDKTTSNGTAKKHDNTVAEPQFPAVLDGVMTDQESANRHPLAIIVENHPDARPQSGLDKASIVYEAIAEGGITRFLAVFSTHEADKVGPVRSVRTYFVDWAHGYDAFLAHVGGNIDALDKIAKEKPFDLDQFKYSGPYWRESSKNLATEHTMYTSTTKLRKQAADNKYSTANNFNIMKFKEDPTEAEKVAIPEKQNISVEFSSANFNVGFNYDKATNSYKRTLAGNAHNDKVTGNQLNPKNVIVMTVKRKATLTRINESGYDMTTLGTGEAKIFIDGREIDGTWRKDSAGDRELFYDATGTEITFNRGQFWICVIPPEGKVTVSQ